MKTMTCNQLGGACDMEFRAETFDEIARMSQDHGQAMFDKNDIPHLEAMQKMAQLMQDPAAMQDWMDEKEREFNSLPENN
jgi:predicted small metal-binding protein